MSDTAALAANVVSSFTAARTRQTVIGRFQGLAVPVPFSLAQVGVGTIGIAFAVILSRWGVPKLLAWGPTMIAVVVLGRAIRRVRPDDRPFMVGVAGLVRQRMRRAKLHPMSNGRTVDVIHGNAVIGADKSLWLLFEVTPLAFDRLSSTETQLGAVTSVEQLATSLDTRRWRLVSEVRHTTAEEVCAAMAATSRASTWRIEVEAERQRLSGGAMARRVFTLMVDIGDARRRETGVVQRWLSKLGAAAGMSDAARADWLDPDEIAAHSARIVAAAPSAARLRPLDQTEIRSMLSRLPGEPPTASDAESDFAHVTSTEPCQGARWVGGKGDGAEGAAAWRLGAAEWTEPVRGIAVARAAFGSTAHTTAVISSLPAKWRSPGGGELLHRLGYLAEAWSWSLDVSVVPPALSKARVRTLKRQLDAQIEQYDGDNAGVPPELLMAQDQADQQEEQLQSKHNASECHVTVTMSTQLRLPGDELTQPARDLLRERVGRLAAVAASVGVSIASPSGDQVPMRRLFVPHRCSGLPVTRDYRQYLLADGIAGLGPAMESQLGDPQGCVLGALDDRGVVQPLLFDPTIGPRAAEIGASPQSPSMGITGRLGSGKSVFLKRTMWTALAAGGAVIAVDRTDKGEYVVFADALAEACPELSIALIDVTDPDAPSIDPMRQGLEAREASRAAVRLLSVVAGLDPRSRYAARLQRTATEMPGTALLHVIKAARDSAEDPEWDRIEDLIDVLASDPVGGVLFDPDRPPAALDADLVVLWAPGQTLEAEPVTPSDLAASAVVLGMTLMARTLVFRDPDRFSALLLDEAWSLIKDPRARALIFEALRDGRKHNAAVWLAAQSPTDFLEWTEMSQLLGSVAVFGVRTYEAAAAGCALAGIDEHLGAEALMDLETGQMLWRDIFGRVGLVDVWLPADQNIAAAILTDPDDEPSEDREAVLA